MDNYKHKDLGKQELISLLDEKIRIEKFLRGEVKELRFFISNNCLPLHKRLRLFLTRLKGKLSKFKTFLPVKSKDGHKIEIKGEIENIDLLVLLPSDQIEIGGIATAYKMIKQLKSLDLKIYFLALTHDPSAIRGDLFISIDELHKVTNINLLVTCGAETASLARSIKKEIPQLKTLMLVQGPDPYFTPKWSDAESFLELIKEADQVVALSPFLKELSTIWGGRNIKTCIMGPDLNVYKMLEESPSSSRNKILLVTCRPNVNKGLMVLLPTLSVLKDMGWKIIGFGILPQHSMARVFDEFLGIIDESELCKLYNRARFVIDPSYIEGLGRVALEAAACGCLPIIQKRMSYDGMFKGANKPYIEIDNFLDPKLLIEAIESSENFLEPIKISSLVQSVSWQTGFESFEETVKRLTKLL